MLNTLQEKNIKGCIIVSQYQNFTDPNTLEKILSFDNIDFRIITEDICKLHTKGYIFRKKVNIKY